MTAQIAKLFLFENLEDVKRTSEQADPGKRGLAQLVGAWLWKIPRPTLLLRNYATCRGAWRATDPRVAALRKKPPQVADDGAEGPLTGVAGWVGRNG